MLEFVINGESRQVSAEQFRTLVDAAVRVIRDASRDSGVEFAVGGLHASQPTIDWAPTAAGANVDVDAEFDRIAARLQHGVDMLERNTGVPEWMTEPTARALYQASAMFGDTEIEGMTLGRGGHRRKITRQTYRTLDRVLHEDTAAIGSVTGVLITATLRDGPHVTVRDETSGRAVRCSIDRATLRDAARWIGEVVVAAGRIRRDYLSRPDRVLNARIELVPERDQVTVAEMGGAYQGGPDSVGWLREQRGR